MIISKQTAQHYIWGSNCDGWPLVDQEGLSVKQERMPAGTKEIRHLHKKAMQFFYVLSGKLNMEIGGETFELQQHQGIEVAPGKWHQAINDSKDFVEFLVISQPSTEGDRFETFEQ